MKSQFEIVEEWDEHGHRVRRVHFTATRVNETQERLFEAIYDEYRPGCFTLRFGSLKEVFVA